MFHNSNTQYDVPKGAPAKPDFSLRDRLIAMGVSDVGAHLAFVAANQPHVCARTYPDHFSA